MSYQALAIASVVSVASAGFAAVTPYSTEFTGDNGTTPAGWTVGRYHQVVDGNGASAFNIQNNQLLYTATQTTGTTQNTSGYARLPLDAADPVMNGSPFVISSQVTPTSLGMSGGNKQTLVGLVAFGSSTFGSTADIEGTSGAPYYWARMSLGGTGTNAGSAGSIQLSRADGDASGAMTTKFTGTIAVGTPLTFNLAGAYNAEGDLVLTFTVSDGTVTSTPMVLVDSDPLEGSYFGYRTRQTAGANYNIGVAFDDYSIAVPEPTSLGLAAVGGLLLLRRRRG